MTLLNRFDLHRPLGVGASGTVFEASDRTTSQTVALKLLHRCDPNDLHRIKSEFRALAEIAHPNLVAIHELFVDPHQRAFFTMELIHGRPFLEYVRPKVGPRDAHRTLPGTPQERLRACLEQLAHGVEYLHAHGKLHRDLKPSNVLVNPLSGRLTLVDFGLVHSLSDRDVAAPEQPEFEGTPAYAAPEQIDPRTAELASDWYAVGVMLYEALAGRRPFADTESVLTDKSRHDPPPPSSFAEPLICPELEPVCMRLLERDPKRRADGRALLAALGRSEKPRLVEPIPAFVGREAELEQLTRAFEQAAAGASGALSIGGQSGIGKTSLAHALLDRLHASGHARVLRGRCYVQEALHYNALDGIVDALTNHLRRLPPDELEPLLPPDAGSLAQLFPMLRRIAEFEQVSLGSSVEGDVRAQAFSALRVLLSRLARQRPIVLFIDDLQWADADSARLLQELLSPPIPAVWLIATERTDAGPDGSIFDRIGYGGHVQRLALGPLSEDAVVDLAQRLIDDCETERACQIARRSGGHPLFASELIRHARAEGDGDGVSVGVAIEAIELETALSARLRSLSPEAQELLELVCLAGERLPQSLLFNQATPQLAALRELRVASAIRDSIVDEEQHVEPYHDRIREVVIARLPALRRQALHSSLAERMRARGSAYLERVIKRYVLAGREREAALLAEEAAQQAVLGFAYHSAAELLELALRHARGDDELRRLRLAAADACSQAGRTLAAAEHYEQAASSATNSTERAELQLRAATNYCAAGHSRRGRALLMQITRDLDIDLDKGPVSFWLGAAWLLVFVVAGVPKLRSRSAYGDPTGPEPRAALQLHMLWRIAPTLMLIDPHQSAHCASYALGMAALQGNRMIYGQALAFCSTLFTLLFGRPSAIIERKFERAAQLVGRDGDEWDQTFVRVMQGGMCLFTGDDARAHALCIEAATATRLGSPFAAMVRSSARMVALLSLDWLGRVDRLAELSETWTKEAVDCGDRQMEVSARVSGLFAHLCRDDVPRALEEIQLARNVELDYLHAWLNFEPFRLANVDLYRGCPEDALAVCRSMNPWRARYSGYNDQMRVVFHLTEGSCAAALAARGQDRDAHLALLRRCARGARFSVGRRSPPIAAQLDASIALLEGDRTRAAVHVHRAIDGYDALGSRLHAASLRLALARLEPNRARELERSAQITFAHESVVDPNRLAYMIAPGLVPEPD